jgi:hypothetical protein
MRTKTVRSRRRNWILGEAGRVTRDVGVTRNWSELMHHMTFVVSVFSRTTQDGLDPGLCRNDEKARATLSSHESLCRDDE